ncbi:MAG TPA: transcriptional repressor LexA [Candidatus Eisenbacteria bacterium]
MRKPSPPKTPGAAKRRRPVFADAEPGPEREQAILRYIAVSLRDRGYPPTLREIGRAFGIASTNGVRYYLDRLEQAGSIRRDRWTSRGIELQAIEGGARQAPRDAGPSGPAATSTRGAGAAAPPSRGSRLDATPAADYLEIPLLGRVAAGAPILAEENIEDTLVVDGSFARRGKHFALRVRGDSMRGAGILDGDMVIVRHDAPAKSGEIVVAVIGEEATVKRYFPRRDRILLLPENEEFQPIEVRETDPEFRLAGKVVGVFRRLD